MLLVDAEKGQSFATVAMMMVHRFDGGVLFLFLERVWRGGCVSSREESCVEQNSLEVKRFNKEAITP